MRPSSAQPYLMHLCLGLAALAWLPELLPALVEHLPALAFSLSLYAQEWRMALAALRSLIAR
jgi:hypothetical protein